MASQSSLLVARGYGKTEKGSLMRMRCFIRVIAVAFLFWVAAAQSPSPSLENVVTFKDLLVIGDDLLHGAILDKAIEDDDPKAFERYLRTHSDINRRLYGEVTLLQAAVSNGGRNVVKFLLERKASVLPTDCRGRRVLDYLDDSELQKLPGFAEIAAMINKRADEELGENEKNPAWGYIRDGENDKLAELLQDKSFNVNLQNRHLESLLFYAMKQDNLNAVRLLLAHGADSGIDDGHERPHRYVSSLKYLFTHRTRDKAADAAIAQCRKAIADGWDVNAPDSQTGKTRLMDECERGNYKLAEFLIAKRANPKLKDKSGKDAYDYARGYHPESDRLIAILDRAGQPQAKGTEETRSATSDAPQPAARPAASPAPANLDANEKNPAWAYIRDRANDELKKLLASEGFNLNLQNRCGDSLLFFAAKSANSEAVEMLLKRGADPDLPNARGRCPAAYARELWEVFDQKDFAEETAQIDMLRKYGVKIDDTRLSDDGKTRLMEACERGDCRMAEFLISRGADPHKKDKSGKTAYDYARAYHPMSDKLVELLDEAGHISE